MDEYIEGAFHQQEGPQTASKSCMYGTLFIDYTFNVVFLYQSNQYANISRIHLPKIYNLLTVKSDSSSQRLVNCAVAVCLPYLAATAKRFWIMSKAFKIPIML